MKNILLTISLFFTINIQAQEDKTVTLVVSGQGKTQEEAKQNALRSAIEQAFGTFISSKTEILNDNLVKDEIVSVANGNIQKFKIISEVKIPSGDYATSLNATVSVTQLTAFVEKKGVVVEMKGGLFAENMKLMNLYESNELIAVEQICMASKSMFNKSLDFDLNLSQPIVTKENSQIFEIKMAVDVNLNNNYSKAADYLSKSLQALSCSKETIKNYQELKKPLLVIHLVDFKGKTFKITLRNLKDKKQLIELFDYITRSTFNFKIASNTETINIDIKYFDKILRGDFRTIDQKNNWHLFGGRENSFKIQSKSLYKIDSYYPRYSAVIVNHSNYAGIYNVRSGNYPSHYTELASGKLFPICFEQKEYSNSVDDGLVLSLYNPFGAYVTTHAINHTVNLEIIEKTTEYKVVPLD